MAARASMSTLIARLRVLIDDPDGASQEFDDEVLQDFLDEHRRDIRYLELTPAETRLPGGSTAYLEYHAGRRYWEADPVLVDNNYGTVTPSTEDAMRGVWEFAANQQPPVYIVGSTYDLYGAAVDALNAWLAKLKGNFDFEADGASFKKSQQIKHIETLIKQYNAVAGPQVATWSRGDMVVG